MNKLRYFIVMYCGNNMYGINITGNFTVRSNNYINNKECIANVKEQSNIKDAVITNIIELNEKDFKEFTR